MKKRLIIITLIFVFVFAVIANKIVNERNVQHLKHTFSEIYEDRLLVESYIYQLTDLFYKKKIDLLYHENISYGANNKKEMQRQTSQIAEVAQKYSLTKLTETERQIFEKFADNIGRLKVVEARLSSLKGGDVSELRNIYESSFNQLKLLSSIQVVEGSLLKENSRKVLSSSHLATQLEWAIVIIIPLLLIPIFRKRKLYEDIFPSHQLN